MINSLKMKTKYFQIILIAIFFSLNSCVEDSDFDIPNVQITEPVITGNETSFQAVVAAFQQAVNGGDDTVTFDTDIYISGYVISSDQSGNFFEELIIQDKADGTASFGFRVDINVSSLYNTYQFGRKVYVKLQGLTFGESNGVYVIGKGEDLDQIQPYEYRDFIIRGSEVADIQPKVTTLADLTSADENLYIQLDDVQFNRDVVGLTYAGEQSDQFDGFRNLESCGGSETIPLQTSTFSDFKSITVNPNRGSIKGIYSRDFRDDFSVLIINTPNDIMFNSSERCDPVILECKGATSTSVTIFEEDFQSITNESQLDGMGWTNVNVSGGSERYEESSFSGNTYLKISAFGTSEDPLEAWLVTPAINLDSTTQEELSFKVSANFETGKILTAFITDNYTGDPTTTDWVELDANIPIGGSGFGDFVSSTINISCLSGNVRVAFKYLGAAGSTETRYHIDDIKVTGAN